MPELPEVETIRRGLLSKVRNKTITKVHVGKANLIKSRVPAFQQSLQNNKISTIDRIGKLLIFALADGRFLLIHLKMTGQLIYKHRGDVVAGGHPMPWLEDLPNKYSHVIIDFQGGAQLFFNDMRQFGYLKIVDESDRQRIVAGYGIEPLQEQFSLANFRKLFIKRQTVLKALLLNQSLIAGLGNIYVDEICWRARVRPDRRVNTLSDREIRRLYKACQAIIKKAIAAGGTTFRDYRDARGAAGKFVRQLKVYGRKDEPCTRCRQQKINKIILVGRGTHYCPTCQQ